MREKVSSPASSAPAASVPRGNGAGISDSEDDSLVKYGSSE